MTKGIGTDHKLKNNNKKKRGRPGNGAIGSTGTHTSGVVSFLMHTKCITYIHSCNCIVYYIEHSPINWVAGSHDD